MRSIFVLLFVPLLLLSNLAKADLVPPTPGHYDSLVLAMSDENDFCLANPQKPECGTGAGSFGMALHGLWPDQREDAKNTYQYCSAVTAQELGQNWCAPATDVAKAIGTASFLELSVVMPGVGSCLYNHEWYAHGTCSGMPESEYFATAAELATRFRALPNFRRLIKKSAGQSLAKADLLHALTADLGPQADSAAVLLCRKDLSTGVAHFQEVDLTLNPQRLAEFPHPASLGESKPFVNALGQSVPDAGNCPLEGIVLTAPSKSK